MEVVNDILQIEKKGKSTFPNGPYQEKKKKNATDE